MNKDELRFLCESQIAQCETLAEWKRERPHGKFYEACKSTLELLDENKLLVETLNECSRKKGKWIFSKTILDKHGFTVECSSCHKKWKTYDEIRWVKENKFCPNCGEPKEGEE